MLALSMSMFRRHALMTPKMRFWYKPASGFVKIRMRAHGGHVGIVCDQRHDRRKSYWHPRLVQQKRFSLADDRRFGARLDFHKTIRIAEPNAISGSKMSISIDGNRTGTQDLCKKTIFTANVMFTCPHHFSSKTICFAVSNAMSGL